MEGNTVERAHVGLELSVEELDTLINLCADNNQFRLGLKLAERKSRLAANVSRAKKDAEKMTAPAKQSGSNGAAK